MCANAASNTKLIASLLWQSPNDNNDGQFIKLLKTSRTTYNSHKAAKLLTVSTANEIKNNDEKIVRV